MVNLPSDTTRASRFIPAAFLCALSVALLAGCGGAPVKKTSAGGLRADADAICAQYQPTSATLEQQFNQAIGNGELEDAAQDFEDQAADFSAMLDELEGLTARLPIRPRWPRSSTSAGSASTSRRRQPMRLPRVTRTR